MTDWQLLRRWINHRDHAAFRVLHERYHAPLLAFATRKLRHRQDAQDLVQKVFLRAARNAHRYDPDRSTVSTWLGTIVRRLIANAYRDRARKRALFEELGEVEGVSRGSADRGAQAAEIQRRVEAAVEGLSDRHREVVERALAGEPQAETAAALGVPRGTVASRLNRARAQLREELRDLGP